MKEFKLFLAFLGLTMGIIESCAMVGPQVPHKLKPVQPEVEGHKVGWWKASFQMKWEEGTEPSWELDVFIAHAIIAPLLDQYKQDLVLWRFHRRATRDQSGHQFSFIFYSSAATARQVFHSIRSARNLRGMKAAGEIIQDIYDDTTTIHKPHIEDTSDPNWSLEMRRSWPYFIMGASQMWLDLITQKAEEALAKTNPSSVEELREFYSLINESIIETWREEGRHALLHHLSALFGYEPVAVYEKRFLRF